MTSRLLLMHLRWGDRSDVGRLASPLFPQEREVSANPFSASFSQSHSSIEKSRRDVSQHTSIETSMTRKSSRDSGSVQGLPTGEGNDSV